MLRLVPLLACVFACFPGVAFSAESPIPVDRISAFVQQEMALQKVPGVAVAVVQGGKTRIARGFGLANVELGVPVGTKTVFQSASLGKQFSAMAVMLQVEEGKLSLDEPLTRIFPGAPASWGAITPRHLLTHTSGIPDYTEGLIDMRRDYSEDEMLAKAFTLPLQFSPGTQWNYSNTGYLLLGIVVRRASGRFYGDVLADRVFAPLGMKSARIISEEDIVPNRAAGYRLVSGELRNQEWVAPQLNTTADGSLYLSLEDMLAWDRGVRAGAVLQPASWKQVYSPVQLAGGKSYPYGFGWFVDTVAGAPRHFHSGSWQGFKTHFTRYLGADISIIVLANLAEAEPARFVDGIAELIDPALVSPGVVEAGS
jgi:CubicO group peptidase (beta-lactamase class C family)